MPKTAQPAPGSPAEKLRDQLVEANKSLKALGALYGELVKTSQAAAYETLKIGEGAESVADLEASTARLIESLNRPAWDWKPAARHIRDWLSKNLASPENVWKSQRRGVELNFQMSNSSNYERKWDRGKFKTLRGQLERKFGMTVDYNNESRYLLQDGTVVYVNIFYGGTPTSETLG